MTNIPRMKFSQENEFFGFSRHLKFPPKSRQQLLTPLLFTGLPLPLHQFQQQSAQHVMQQQIPPMEG
jgi:hypothetical protein